MKNPKYLLGLGAFFALLAVAMGAFGAHALSARLQDLGSQAVWQTAVDYQMWHALAVLLLIALKLQGRAAKIAAYCFCLGVPLFSGSLYWLALDGPRWLGPVTPIGGLLFLSGWALLIFAAFQQTQANTLAK